MLLKMGLSGTPRAMVGLGCALLMTVSTPTIAREDPSLFVARADQMGEAGSGTKAIEDVLFPALAAMDPRPEWMDGDRTRFIKCVPGSADWAEAEAWVMGDPQRDAIEALATCTDATGGTKWVLGLPYGTDSLDPVWVEKGLSISLSQANLLATARFEYFGGLDALRDLVLLKIHRQANAGEGEAALETAIDLVRLGRYVSERPFSDESVYGYALMSVGLQAMRDAAYTYPDAFRDRQVLVEAAGALAYDDLKWTQFIFPEGEKLAAEQLMARTIVERRGVDEAKYIETLSALSSNERPLRRFGAADRWRSAAVLQGDWFATESVINRVWGDLKKRWDYRLSNSQHARETDLEMLSNPANEMVVSVARKVMRVFPARRVVLNELGATRIALASVAWKTTQFDWPPGGNTAALRPNYLSAIDTDLYNWHPRWEAFQPFGYFVPIRDENFDMRVDPHPHAVIVSVNPSDPYFSSMFQAGSRLMHGGTLTAIREPGAGPSAGSELSVQSGDVSQSDLLAKAMTEDLLSYYDLQTQKIDPEKYRQYMSSGGAEGSIDAIIGFAALAKRMDPTLSADDVNWDSLLDRVISAVPPGMPPSASMGNALTEIGIDRGLFKQLFLKQFEAINADPDAQRGLRSVINGGTPGGTEMAKMREVIEASLTSPEVIEMQERLLGQILNGPAGAELRAELTADGSSAIAFTRMIDDSQFLLYSVGPDRYDNRARNVGSEGDDILYWPPVVSLYRASITGN